LILASAAFAPSKTTTVASLTQPTTASFTPPTLTWGAAARDQFGNIVTKSQTVTVQSADGANYTIYGYAVVDTAIANVLFSEALDTPMSLADALTFFLLTCVFAPGNPSGVGAVVGS
jgi:hypothetical protein